MKLLEFFRGKRGGDTANIAKERLSLVIAHERNKRTDEGPSSRHAEYLPKLKLDVLEAIRKYVAVDEDDVTVRVDRGDDHDVLELNINLPNQAA